MIDSWGPVAFTDVKTTNHLTSVIGTAPDGFGANMVWYQPGNSPAVQSDEAVPAYADISSRHICRIQAVSKAFSLKRGATVIHRFWG